MGQAEMRGYRAAHHRSAWRPSTRNSSTPRSTSSTGPIATRSRSSSGSIRAACISGPTSTKEAEGKTGLGVYPDGMVEHDGQVGRAAEEARRPRDRRQHHRDLHHRQRRRGHDLAGRRHHAVPRREEHQLGGWLSRAGAGALARPGQAGHGDQRHLLGRGLGADPDGRGRRTGPQGQAPAGRDVRRQELQGPSRRLRPARSAEERHAAARARSSSTGRTTASWPGCATTSGSSSSWSSARTASTSGRTR